MFDIWLGDINLTVLILVLSVVLVLPIQTLLCFKARSRTIRLLPVLIFFAFAVIFLILNLFTPGWNGLGYLILAIYAVFLMLMCGIGWGIWAIGNVIKKKGMH